MEFKYFVYLFIALTIGSCQAAKLGGRIFGGDLNTIENMPYLVRLTYNGNFYCTGSLVAPNKVLTAAHCIYGFIQDNLGVVAGTSFLDRGGITAKVIHIVQAPDFSNETKRNDYAVLKLNTTLVGDHITTIGLCTEPAPLGTKALVGGWGYTESGILQPSNQLRSAVISKRECTQYFRMDPKKVICASEPGLKDTCNGDSGGPLVINRTIHGILTGGKKCGDPNIPGIFVDVCALRKPIEAAIAKA